jgi:hypothetical protein
MNEEDKITGKRVPRLTTKEAAEKEDMYIYTAVRALQKMQVCKARGHSRLLQR